MARLAGSKGKVSFVIDGRSYAFNDCTMTQLTEEHGFNEDKYVLEFKNKSVPVMSGSAYAVTYGGNWYPDSITVGDFYPTEERYESMSEVQLSWITKDSVKGDYSSSKPFGLAFFIEERSDLFCSDPTSRIECRMVDFAEYTFNDWDNYQMCLLVTGFKKPRSSWPLWNKPLTAKKLVRGNVTDGTSRSVYIYLPEELELGVCVGLTVHDYNGTWSNYPHHKFEIDALCAPTNIFKDFSEKFAYITETPNMWGITGYSNTRGEKKVYAFADKDIVGVPLGAHFSIAMPGQRLAYVWAYINGGSKEDK